VTPFPIYPHLIFPLVFSPFFVPNVATLRKSRCRPFFPSESPLLPFFFFCSSFSSSSVPLCNQDTKTDPPRSNIFPPTAASLSVPFPHCGFPKKVLFYLPLPSPQFPSFYPAVALHLSEGDVFSRAFFRTLLRAISSWSPFTSPFSPPRCLFVFPFRFFIHSQPLTPSPPMSKVSAKRKTLPPPAPLPPFLKLSRFLPNSSTALPRDVLFLHKKRPRPQRLFPPLLPLFVLVS